MAKTRKREFLGLRASSRGSREGVMHCTQEEVKGPHGTDSKQRAPSPASCVLALPGKYAGPGSLQRLRVGLCPTEGTPSHGEGGPSPSLWSKCGQTDRSARKSRRLGAKAVWMWGACPQVLSGCQRPAPGTVGPRLREEKPQVHGYQGSGGRGGPSQLAVQVTQVILLPAAHAGQIIGCRSRTRTS